MAVTARKQAAIAGGVAVAGALALAAALWLTTPRYAPTPPEYNAARAARGLAPVYYPGDTVSGEPVPEGFLIVVDAHHGLERPCHTLGHYNCERAQTAGVYWHYIMCFDTAQRAELSCATYKDRYK